MSSSLFADCFGTCESYPKTEIYDGQKTFGDVNTDDKIYYFDNFTCEISELVVKNKMITKNNHLIIPIKKFKFGKTIISHIDFGPINVANVIFDAPKSSIVHYLCGIIGTNKDIVIKNRIEFFDFELKDVKNKYDNLKYKINKLKTF